jgi:hypothetical protein
MEDDWLGEKFLGKTTLGGKKTSRDISVHLSTKGKIILVIETDLGKFSTQTCVQLPRNHAVRLSRLLRKAAKAKGERTK